MGRRFHIWWVMLGILVIGTCVTKMTRNFVMEHGVETTVSVLLASEYDAGMPAAGEAMTGYGRLISENTAAMTENVAAQESAIAIDAAMIEDIAVSNAVIDEEKEETAPAATVKSPLDPFVESKTAYVPIERGQTVYSREELQSRFDKTEETVSELWSNIAANSEEAVCAAAEQERMLWVYELKLVTEAVQRNMSKEENEAFKILEAEWMKERDFYAAQKSAGSQNKNGQTTEYARAVAEKTKERCYWMLSQYESILNRRNGQ